AEALERLARCFRQHLEPRHAETLTRSGEPAPTRSGLPGPGGAQWCLSLSWLPCTSCALISPAGRPTEWTFTYVAPALIAWRNSSNSPAAMPCAAAPAPMSAGRIVPLIVPPLGGHAWVPGGPLPRFEHRNTTMLPLFVFFSKWMCDCVAGLSSPP